jgi:hypothetical protein
MRGMRETIETMIVYHVTSIKKFDKYRKSGIIKSPVRAWVDVKEAERFSVSTGRPIILRLKFPPDAEVLEDHKGMARVLRDDYKLNEQFGVKL